MTPTPETRVVVPWPPIKKAIWDVLMGAKLNVGYIAAEPLTEKLFEAVLAAAPAPEPGPAGYISPDNGQGMGLPDKCRCGGVISWNGRFSECQACGTSWGNDPPAPVAAPAAPAPEPVARFHITSTDTYPEIDVEVLNGETLQPSMSPVEVYTSPPAPVAASAVIPGPERQLDRITIGGGEYVRWDEAIKTITHLKSQLATPSSDDSKAVRVRELEWREYEREGEVDEWDAAAGAFGVYYDINLGSAGYGLQYDHDPSVNFDTLEAAKAAAQADYDRRVRACLEPGQGWRKPSYCYNPHDWETTYPWADRDLLADGMDSREPMEVATLIQGPTTWVAYIPSDDADLYQWFASEAAALAAIAAALPPPPAAEEG